MLMVEKNELFDLAFRFVTETNENIFLTGKAGTGKTTFLKYLQTQSSKNMIVAAPTGVAAINAGGITLHSLFQLPLHPYLPTKNNKEALLEKLKFNRQKQLLLRKLELLVIDEISMVRCDTMDAIDTILKSVRRNYQEPFGGVQLLAIGDLYQLPPVAQRHEWDILREYYSSPFFFESHAVKEQMPILIELEKIYRQKEDSFVTLLNQIRNNQLDQDGFEQLHQRYRPGFRPANDEKYITLTSHNNQAEVINHRELHKLTGNSQTYHAEIEGEFPENSYPAEGQLILKEGAQVMFLKNDVLAKRYFNGKIGVVKEIKESCVIVDCDGVDIQVWPEVWENTRYSLNKTDEKLEQEVIGTFSQLPLRLAWAITIHKSQGLTFEQVIIDAGAAFSSGQVYVALSRATRLDGIILSSKIPPAAIINNESVRKGQENLRVKGSLAERFVGARQIFTQQLLEEIFAFEEAYQQVKKLKSAIITHREKLNAKGEPWLEKVFEDVESSRNVGLKFIQQVGSYLREEPVVEKNSALLERIKLASAHFLPIFSDLENETFRHPIETEYRESATVVNQYLSEFYLAVLKSKYYLEYCNASFSISDFLKHKMNWKVPNFQINVYASGNNHEDAPDDALFRELKNWRDEICQQTGAPIYMVANQEALREICELLPISKEHLLQVKGFGHAKVSKYGDDILAIVQQYCDRHQLQTRIENIAQIKKERKPKTNTAKNTEEKPKSKEISFNLFKEGKNIATIAKERNLAQSTIEGHLVDFVAEGLLEIDSLMPRETQDLISGAIALRADEGITKLKENLPEWITYSEIRFVMAARKNLQDKSSEMKMKG